MEVYYINHKNQKIDLGKSPYQMEVGNVFNFSYKYEGSNNKITRIYKDVTTISTNVTIDSKSEEDFYQSANAFFEIIDVDNIANKRGKLYIGEYYVECNVISSDKNFWKETFRGMENAVKILVPYPCWCCETAKTFLKGNIKDKGEETDPYLYYPFGYPYQYSAPQDVRFIQNDHYAACDFKMVIFGTCTNPAIMINGHLYEVRTSIYDGERLEIDSRNHTVHRHMNDGRIENLFNLRNKENNLFEKIPNGRCNVLWNIEAFGFDLTLYKERSEPKWIL